MEWFETWFDTPYYHLLYNNHDDAEAQAFIVKMLEETNLPKDSSIIDLACGKGRHSRFLNQLGYNVLGLDLSKQSIDYDKQFENDHLKFKVHDMRDPIQSSPVDMVVNLFTSFGYFDEASDDKKVFHSVADALKKDGYFVLDFMNSQYVKDHLIPYQQVDRDGTIFNIHKKIENNFIIKEIDFEYEGQKKHYYEKVKLHDPSTLESYGKEVNLKLFDTWGDYEGKAYKKEYSPRCIQYFIKE